MDITVIQKRISQLEKFTHEIREAKQMIKEELENDLSYLEAAEEVKAATAKRKQIKDTILSQGANQKLVETIKHNNEEIGLLKDILSAELFEIYQENKSDEFADENGESRKFKVLARLLPKGARSYDERDNYGKYSNSDE